MIVFIMLYVILSIAFAIKMKLKISTEESLFVSTFGMTVFTYVLGLINLLGLSIYIISILAVISTLYTINKLIKKEEKISKLVTLPTIIYIVIIFVLYYFIKDTEFGYYDEFMFWGYNLKEMINNSCLWASYKIDGIHLTYPPFTAIAEYIFCKFNGGFSESVAYFAIDTLMITALMPLFKNEGYKLKSFVKVIWIIVITYIALILFCYNIVNLSVDCVLGIIFGVSMYIAYTLKSKKDCIVLIFLLISLTLIKINGILLAGIVIMQIFLKDFFSAIQNKKLDIKNLLFKSRSFAFSSYHYFWKLAVIL